jgi:glucan biosynthesis protein C
VTPAGNLPINGRVARILAQPPLAGRTPPRRSVALRLLLACGMAAPVLALASTLLAVAAYPHFNHARQYLSELGGATAARPAIFNAGVFAAGFLAALAGVGFGLAIAVLTRARIAGGLTATVFLLAGYGLAQAAIYPWPDPRHLAINLGLGIQIAPLLLLWGLWPRRDLRGLKLFLAAVFVAMAVLTVLTKHLVLPRLVNDFNVGWWERGYAIILVGWVGVAAFVLDRCLGRQAAAEKTA